MAESYKLSYYKIEGRGRAEPARMMFAMVGQKYEDVEVDRETEWPALKPTIPGGRLPCLETSQGKLIQAAAIYMYVAGKLGFVPETLYERAQSSSILMTMNEIFIYVQENMLKEGATGDFDTHKDRAKEMFDELKELTTSIKKPGVKFIHGDKVTVTDVVMFCTAENIRAIFPGLTGGDWLKDFMDNMRADSQVDQYLKNRN